MIQHKGNHLATTGSQTPNLCWLVSLRIKGIANFITKINQTKLRTYTKFHKEKLKNVPMAKKTKQIAPLHPKIYIL